MDVEAVNALGEWTWKILEGWWWMPMAGVAGGFFWVFCKYALGPAMTAWAAKKGDRK